MSNVWQGGKVSKPEIKTEKSFISPKFDFQKIEMEKKKSLDLATGQTKINPFHPVAVAPLMSSR